MNAETIRQVIMATKPPLHLYTSDGRIVYVDHPQAVLISDTLIAIGTGRNNAEQSEVIQQIIPLAPDHVVRIEPTKRKVLRRVA